MNLIYEYCNLINVYLVIEFCDYKYNNNCDENIIYKNAFYKCKDIECNVRINNIVYSTYFDEAINYY